ncbi:MAG: YitT family protein [Dorea sp.]
MKKEKIANIILAFVGIVLVGTGVAFNAAAALGNDPVGIVYDGIRNAANLSSEQLGIASNIVNFVLCIVVFLMNRHYVNVGTFIYIIPYGTVVDMGGKLYHILIKTQTLPFQIMGAAAGCLLLYTGVAMFITADIGLDPFTGVVMVLKDKVGKEYRTVKVIFDIGCIVLGFVLGGKLGVITIITALSAGPVIQFLSNIMKKCMERLIQSGKAAM